MKAQIQKVIELQRAVTEAATEITNLSKKSVAMEAELVEFKSAAREAEEDRRNTLVAHVAGTVGRGRVSQSREETERAARDVRDLEEILTALTNRVTQCEEAQPALEADLQVAKRMMWRTIQEDIKARTRTAFPVELLCDLQVAKNMAGESHSSQLTPAVIHNVVGHVAFTPEQREARRKALIAQYRLPAEIAAEPR